MFIGELAAAFIFPILFFGITFFLIPLIDAIKQYPTYKKSGGKQTLKRYLINYFEKI